MTQEEKELLIRDLCTRLPYKKLVIADVDKKGKISVQFKNKKKKIKTNLRLPAREVTYLRYIMDSHFIPVNGTIKKAKKGFKVMVTIG